MKTERIELADGAWWEIRTVYTVGMAKTVEELLRPYVKPKNLKEVMDGKSKELQYDIDIDGVDLFGTQRAVVFAATVAWSYGDVTLKVFDEEVPQADYLVVSRRCDELFSSVPLPGQNAKK